MCLHLIRLLVVSSLIYTIRMCVQSCLWQPLLSDYLCSRYRIPRLHDNRLGWSPFVVGLLRSSGVGSRAGSVFARSGSRCLVVSRTRLRLCRGRVFYTKPTVAALSRRYSGFGVMDTGFVCLVFVGELVVPLLVVWVFQSPFLIAIIIELFSLVNVIEAS